MPLKNLARQRKTKNVLSLQTEYKKKFYLMSLIQIYVSKHFIFKRSQVLERSIRTVISKTQLNLEGIH